MLATELAVGTAPIEWTPLASTPALAAAMLAAASSCAWCSSAAWSRRDGSEVGAVKPGRTAVGEPEGIEGRFEPRFEPGIELGERGIIPFDWLRIEDAFGDECSDWFSSSSSLKIHLSNSYLNEATFD